MKQDNEKLLEAINNLKMEFGIRDKETDSLVATKYPEALLLEEKSYVLIKELEKYLTDNKLY